MLDVSGQIKQMTWLEDSRQWKSFLSQPRTPCEVYTYCGPFGICNLDSHEYCECLPGFEPRFLGNWQLQDRTGGCVRKADLQCVDSTHAKGKKDQFVPVSSVRLPVNGLTFNVSRMDCESGCLNNCSCSAYAYDYGRCTVWSGDLLNLQQLPDSDSGGSDFQLKLAYSELNRR